MKKVHFDLTDADGQSHRYEVELFSVKENARLQLLCAQPLLKAVGRLAGVLAPALRGIGDEGGDFNLADALGKIDWGDAPEALLAIPEMIEERGGPDLVTRIFARTNRLIPVPEARGIPSVDGRVVDPNIRQDLSQEAIQDDVFGDGNMGEYWQAAAMVLLVNFTRYGRVGSPSWRTLVGKLTGGLLTPSTRTTGTTAPSDDSTNARTPQPTS